MVKEGIVLGHKVTAHGIEVDRAKVDVIARLPPPMSVKSIRSFLGYAGFNRRFIKNLSSITKPLTALLAKDVNDVAVGAILGQRKEKMFRPIYYASRTLNDAQVNYATTEKEFFAVVFSFDKFRSYLVGSKVNIHTDHSSLKYLLSKKDSKPRRVDMREEFPNEQIFSIVVISKRPPWYADVANFLASRLLSRDLSRDQRRKLQDGVIRKCVSEGEMASILSHCHDGAAGSHYGGNRTASKVMTVSACRKDWSAKLDEALWAYRTAFKTTIWTSPFKLVYGKSCHLPVGIEHKAYWAVKMLNLDLSIASTMSHRPSKHSNTGTSEVASSSRRRGRQAPPSALVEEEEKYIDPDVNVVPGCKYGIRVVPAHARIWYQTLVPSR
ncbi:uncharacterized protein LOC142178270 [Nicotiana tabacum]|uniref:Uncharacterized protein LOC142178270 n=1 Tax=Nicotiana tabacum TaxID=4097 RepID=A0AC58U2I3_TOBAC